MIDLMPIELMIQKTGISAYIRLKKQLATPFQTQGNMTTTHLQYWENLISNYNIKHQSVTHVANKSGKKPIT